jgi:2-keto-4-pentenoate hydratase/2-oxohepta-3-ene-1,7-dioic acid hydratase in catechol pathway
LDPGGLAISCRVNGRTRQAGNTRDMVFPVAELIAFVSSIMTLEPGDLLTTGTPAGVGALLAGDEVEVEVEGIGVLRNHVVDRADR